MKPNKFFKSGITLVVSLLFFANISFAQKNNLRVGIWRGVLHLNDSTQLPFNFDVKYDLDFYSVVFHNADERIVANEIAIQNDSVFIRMPLFDSEFRCINSGDSLKGVWINHARKNKNIIPFTAKYNESRRFLFPPTNPLVLKERYKVIFEPGSKDEYFSVGTFDTESGKTKGTFSTETGDYRYLEGYSANGKFMVSCFDGAHAFLFTAKRRKDSLLNGQFYSGIAGHENWVGSEDPKFELRNPDSLTFLKKGFTKIDFSFKNLDGKTISLQDEKFKNKVVIVQIMGSWCPNCMDETKFLASFYDKYKSKGLEVVGLAFERTDDFNKAVSNVDKLKKRFNAHYEFLITGKTGAVQASEALPMLSAVMAFPTAIYIDKKGTVRKIYTGFYGPATGDAYTKYEEETTLFIEKLLAE
ncbi:MAG: TlpA disulfide reductase family protein [Bacteroidetes bacterium]|nr:TlpA disulfide reductase family protein [Bacteroidota bacterium]